MTDFLLNIGEHITKFESAATLVAFAIFSSAVFAFWQDFPPHALGVVDLAFKWAVLAMYMAVALSVVYRLVRR